MNSQRLAHFENIVILLLCAGFNTGLTQTMRDVPSQYSTIQSAINVAVNGDTLLIQPGLYNENINLLGKNLIIGSLFLKTADTNHVNLTIIDGNNSNNVITLGNQENMNCKIVGLTIQHSGSQTGQSNAGISLVDASATIANCRIINNAGNGIYASGASTPLIESNLIAGNGSSGVYFGYGASGTIRDNTILNNRIGISTYQASPPTIEGNKVSYNQLHGIYITFSGGGKVHQSLINNNGVGIYSSGSGNIEIINCTVASNSGLGISRDNNSVMLVKNSIVWQNAGGELRDDWATGGSLTVTYSDIKGGWSGTGIMNSDPSFLGGQVGYALSSASPCINAGDPTSPSDRDGTRADMGAFYYDQDSEEPFTDISAPLTGVAWSSAAWGDYDSDGDLDILLTGNTGSGYVSKIYQNDAGAFADISAPFVGVWESSTAWNDYDNDGDLDILLTGNTSIEGPNSNPVSIIYRNDGGSFVDIPASLVGVYRSSVAWGDYDNDGDSDILLTGESHSGLQSRIYRNDSGTFVDIAATIEKVYYSAIAWGDYDNDGDLDIFLTGLRAGDNSVTKVYRNENGSFTDISSSLPAASTASLDFGDFDSDGDLDLLLAGWNNSISGFSRIYRNVGGNFVDISAALAPANYGAVKWGDLDNDGDFDVLLTGSEGPHIAKVYRNDVATFVDIGALLEGVYSSSVAWGDYDNDGDLDILLTGEGGPTGRAAKLYRNNSAKSNTTATPPANLQSAVNADAVTLNWNKSTDSESAQNALTYNLRVGTTPGGMDVVSPMANLNTGYRRIPKLGNTNHNTSWTIRNLEPGIYYWSVQAIDNAFAGSPFAAEQSFTIGGGPVAPAAPRNQAGRSP